MRALTHRFNYRLALSMVLIASCSEYLLANEISEDSSMSDISEAFRGKIVMIEIDRSSALESKSNHAVLKDAQVLLIGDRYFIQGKGHTPKGYEGSWYKNAVVGISWSDVTRYYVMTLEQFEEYSEQYSKNRETE